MVEKGQEQVYAFQHNALTSLHFVQLYIKVDLGCKCIALEGIYLFLSFFHHS